MKTYEINWKHARTPNGEDYFRSGTLGKIGKKPVKIAILPRINDMGWRVVLQGDSYSSPLTEDEEPTTLEDCFTLALEWYQARKRSDAHVSQ